jgi:hypothetical protein
VRACRLQRFRCPGFYECLPVGKDVGDVRTVVSLLLLGRRDEYAGVRGSNAMSMSMSVMVMVW